MNDNTYSNDITVTNQANANAQATANSGGSSGGGVNVVLNGAGVFIGIAILLAVLFFLLGRELFLSVLFSLAVFTSIIIIIWLIAWYHKRLKREHYREFFAIGQHFSSVAVDVLTASTHSQAELHKTLGGITAEAIRTMRKSGALERTYPPMLGPGSSYQLPDGKQASMNLEILDLDDDEEWQ